MSNPRTTTCPIALLPVHPSQLTLIPGWRARIVQAPGRQPTMVLAKLRPERFGEAVQHQLAGPATMVVTLPAQQPRVIEGSAAPVELLEEPES
jgi:hypothetical protein